MCVIYFIKYYNIYSHHSVYNGLYSQSPPCPPHLIVCTSWVFTFQDWRLLDRQGETETTFLRVELWVKGEATDTSNVAVDFIFPRFYFNDDMRAQFHSYRPEKFLSRSQQDSSQHGQKWQLKSLAVLMSITVFHIMMVTFSNSSICVLNRVLLHPFCESMWYVIMVLHWVPTSCEH